MLWEGRVAAGLAGLVVLVPLLSVPAVLTALAVHGGATPWLWAWLLVPVLGLSGPAGAVAHRFERPAPGHALGATARFELGVAWSTVGAEPDWEVRITPALPGSWPPPGDGTVVWFGFAERPQSPQTSELSAPWARFTLAPGATTPRVERFPFTVNGPQATRPIDPRELRRRRPAASAEELRAGARPEDVARGLAPWRELQPLTAAHPLLAAHLPRQW